LNKRNRIGKEGSRRFNYWSNEFFAQTLVRSSNDSEGENDVWDDEYDDKYEPSHGFFSDIFHDDDKCKLWEPFLEVTEEQQNQLLSELSDPSEEDSEEENYYAGLEYMSRYTRQTLKKKILKVILSNILTKNCLNCSISRMMKKYLVLTIVIVGY